MNPEKAVSSLVSAFSIPPSFLKFHIPELIQDQVFLAWNYKLILIPRRKKMRKESFPSFPFPFAYAIMNHSIFHVRSRTQKVFHLFLQLNLTFSPTHLIIYSFFCPFGYHSPIQRSNCYFADSTRS